MKHILFACCILSLLSACKKEKQEPEPAEGTTTPPVTDLHPLLPKKSVSVSGNGYSAQTTFSYFSYYTDGSLKSVITYDSLYPEKKDSFLFTYAADGQVSQKTSFTNSTGDPFIRKEFFTYNANGKLLSHEEDYINAAGNMMHGLGAYYHYHLYTADDVNKVAYVLTAERNGAVHDSLVVDGTHITSFENKGAQYVSGSTVNPEADGFAYKIESDFLITDFGIYEGTGYISGITCLTKTIFLPNELSLYLFPGGTRSYPVAGLYSHPSSFKYLLSTPDFEGKYVFDDQDRLRSCILYHKSYSQGGSPMWFANSMRLYY